VIADVDGMTVRMSDLKLIIENVGETRYTEKYDLGTEHIPDPSGWLMCMAYQDELWDSKHDD